jgi:hypothetical protein
MVKEMFDSEEAAGADVELTDVDHGQSGRPSDS